MTRDVIQGPLDGLTFVVERSAGAGGPTVVFLHSEMGAFGPAPVGEAFRASHEVVSLHLPGWGESTGIEHFDNPGEFAVALWWAVERIASEPVVLVGHGLGAALALEMAIMQPKAVRGLVLSNPFGMFDEAYPGVDIFALMPKDVMPHVYADPNGPVMAAHYPAPTDAYERGLQAIRRVEVLGSASRFVFPLPDTNIVKRAYRIADVPMSLVFGERDGVVPPEMAHNWSKVFPSASVRTVAGTAHMTPYESDAVAEEVAAMVKNVVASA